MDAQREAESAACIAVCPYLRIRIDGAYERGCESGFRFRGSGYTLPFVLFIKHELECTGLL